MAVDRSLERGKRLASRLRVVGMALLALGFLAVLTSALVPLRVDLESLSSGRPRQVPPLPERKQDVEPLLAQMAGRRLIRPPQAQAAVKDSGVAREMLKKLTLQGVAKVGQDRVAYVLVQGQGVVTVRENDAVLGFVVQKIEAGKVTLSLEGVEVALGH